MKKVIAGLMAGVMMLAMLVGTVFAENNTLNSAAAINVNQDYQGMLESSGDVDFYSFTLTQNGNVTVTMPRQSGSSWRITVSDGDATTYKSFNTAYSNIVSGNESADIGLPPGTYFIRIEEYTNAGKIPYGFRIGFTPSEFYEKEFNNSLQTSNPINVNQTYKGTLQTSNDTDFYKFTLTQPGNLTLKMPRISNSSWRVTLMDGNANTYKSFNTAYANIVSGDETAQIGLPAGDYYVRVEEYTNASDVPYSLTAAFTASAYYEREFNNSLQTSNPISVNQLYNGTLQTSNDVDFYSFTLTKNGNVSLSMPRKSNSSWRVTLSDGSGNTYTSFSTAYTNIVSGNETVQVGLPPGTYYVRIEEYTNATDIPYSFKVGFTASEFYEKEFNQTLQTANPIRVNQGYNGTLQSSNDSDFYAFTLAAKSKVRLSINRKNGSSWYVKVLDGQGNSLGYVNTNYSDNANGVETLELSLPRGTFYVQITEYTSASNVPYSFKVGIVTNALVAKQVAVVNNKAKNDTVTVSGTSTGDIIRIYDAKGKLLATSTPAESGKKVVLSIKQLGTKASYLYVSNTNKGALESAKLKVNYSAEGLS